MSPEPLLFGLALFLYFTSSVASHVHLFTGSEAGGRVASYSALAGLAVHTAALGFWCVTHEISLLRHPRLPYSIAAYLIVLLQVALSFRPGWMGLGSLAMPLAFIFQSYAFPADPATTLASGQSNAWVRPHVVVLLLGFASFALAFCLAVIYLVQSRLLKAKQVRGFFRRLPPLMSVSNAAHWLAVVGFSMLTLGIITGAIVAPEYWGPRWYLDARAVTSLVAWAIYAAYIAASTLLGWRGRRTTYFLIAGFLVVAIAFVASVNRPRAVSTRPTVTGPAIGNPVAAEMSAPGLRAI